MENINNFSEDDNKIFSLSDKMTFASSGITSFQISEPNNKKKTCRCCVWSVIIYLVMLTGGMGFLAYEVYMMHKFINNMKEARASMLMNHLSIMSPWRMRPFWESMLRVVKKTGSTI
ncbi:hypothetical protein E2320_020366 [Naja naja]|nr:hypothetical protein E2320_020366 [Naja naja]